jgi:hypothetical protein
MSAEETATLLATLQSELVGLKAETAVKVASLEDTITELAHENALLKRRLYGNKTERSYTSELQLALGDLLASEAQLQKDLDAAVEKAKGDAEPEPKQSEGSRDRAKPKGRRDLFASNLPRCLVEILDEELEAQGCRRIGFEESKQLMFRRGGFAVLVKRVAKYEVIEDGSPTVVTVPSPETLFPRALLHTSTIAQRSPVIMSSRDPRSTRNRSRTAETENRRCRTSVRVARPQRPAACWGRRHRWRGACARPVRRKPRSVRGFVSVVRTGYAGSLRSNGRATVGG